MLAKIHEQGSHSEGLNSCFLLCSTCVTGWPLSCAIKLHLHLTHRLALASCYGFARWRALLLAWNEVICIGTELRCATIAILSVLVSAQRQDAGVTTFFWS